MKAYRIISEQWADCNSDVAKIVLSTKGIAEPSTNVAMISEFVGCYSTIMLNGEKWYVISGEGRGDIFECYITQKWEALYADSRKFH